MTLPLDKGCYELKILTSRSTTVCRGLLQYEVMVTKYSRRQDKGLGAGFKTSRRDERRGTGGAIVERLEHGAPAGAMC